MSQSQSIQEQDVVYQEDEVVWAKIRGYPWWPAAINQVHAAKSEDQDDEQFYTVFFFGDNTHSQLGPQKLRKFLEFYPQFYPKAKTNKKLFSSIMRAEQKLKHNGVNTDYYVNFRQSLKKGKKGKSGNHTQSRISSQDHGHQLMSELPQLNKNKTFERGNRSQQQQSQSHQIKHESAPQKTRGRPATKKKQQKIVKMKSQSQEEDELKENQQQKQIFEEEEEQPVKLANRTRSRQNARLNQNKIEKEKSQSQSSEESELQNFNEKKSNQLKVNKVKPIVKTEARKRGRPKKIRPEEQQTIVIEKVQQNIPLKVVQKQKPKQKSVFTQERVQRIPPKRRVIERKNMNQEQEIQSQNDQISEEKHENPIQSKQLNTLILQRIKFCLNKRDQLIEYLDELPVGPENVQQILELNVTNILLHGPPSIQVIRIMQKLKANLLYKFFPNDLKFRKKMQKINKKISNRNNTEAEEESLEDLELRKKTIIKLQKILRQTSPQDIEENNQKMQAIEIQSNFRKYDETIGQAYKLLAYRILRALKDKKQTAKDVIRKLQNNEYDNV